MRNIFSFFTLVVMITSTVLAQEGGIASDDGQEKITISIPSQEVATPKMSDRDVESVAKMVLSGEVKVDHSGEIRIAHPQVSRGLGRAEARRISRREAEVARIDARIHGHAIGNEAVRKSNLVANKALNKATNYTDRKVFKLEEAIAVATTWGMWGVGLAVIALFGVLGLLLFLLFRVLRGPEERY